MTDYPADLCCERTLRDGRRVVIRPIRAEDEPAEKRFFAALSSEAKRLRFMKFVREVAPRTIHSFTHVDYDRTMAFVCESAAGGAPGIVGEARYAALPGGKACEFGIVIADAWHKSGIAGLLMAELIRAARDKGYETMESIVLRENRDERRFARALGFEETRPADDPATVRVVKRL